MRGRGREDGGNGATWFPPPATGAFLPFLSVAAAAFAAALSSPLPVSESPLSPLSSSPEGIITAAAAAAVFHCCSSSVGTHKINRRRAEAGLLTSTNSVFFSFFFFFSCAPSLEHDTDQTTDLVPDTVEHCRSSTVREKELHDLPGKTNEVLLADRYLGPSTSFPSIEHENLLPPSSLGGRSVLGQRALCRSAAAEATTENFLTGHLIPIERKKRNDGRYDGGEERKAKGLGGEWVRHFEWRLLCALGLVSLSIGREILQIGFSHSFSVTALSLSGVQSASSNVLSLAATA